MERLCGISVDLDAIRYYRAIHGLVRIDENDDHWLGLAVSRLASWAKQLGFPLTWFVVGRDLDRESLADSLFGLWRRGHELANHSLDHHYDLTRRGSEVMREQVFGGFERLSRLTGKAQHGFRAPGYTMTDELQSLLIEHRVLYDSSVFPCPVYYGAKAVALAGQRWLGRKSSSIVDSPAVLTAPIVPYRMGGRYCRSGAGLLELPIQVTRRLRLPYIGTSLITAGMLGSRLLTNGVVGLPFVNLELHAIDALDAGDGLREVARVQPDLRIEWSRKLALLSSVVSQLRRDSYRLVTLEHAAEIVIPASQ